MWYPFVRPLLSLIISSTILSNGFELLNSSRASSFPVPRMGKGKTKMFKLTRRRFIHDFEIESWKDLSFNYEWNVKNSQKTVSHPHQNRDANWWSCVCFVLLMIWSSLFSSTCTFTLCAPMCVYFLLNLSTRRNSRSSECVLYDNVNDVVDDISSLIWRGILGIVCRCFWWNTFIHIYCIYIVICLIQHTSSI